MCRITQCCCCCGLRIGTYLAAAYTIALGLIGAIVAGVAGGAATSFKNMISGSRDTSDDQKQAANTGFSIIEIIMYITMAIYLLWVIFAVIMIYGAAKSRRGYLIPWIIMTIIVTIFCGISILISLISIAVIFSNATTAISFIINIALFVLNIYSLVGVTSFYKDDCVDRTETGGKQVV